jgi:uroporphyrinogen III methyltransferase/synthase
VPGVSKQAGFAADRWNQSSPLFGKRVLVTRAKHQAEDVGRELRARGAIPVSFPTIRIVPLIDRDSDPLAGMVGALSAATYDWVVFTSQNTVRCLCDAIFARGRDARLFGRVRIAAIGPKTAEALRAYGLGADLVAKEFVAESLVASLLESLPPAGRVLLPRAKKAREVLPDRLREAGRTVDVVPVYETTAPEAADVAAAIEDVVANGVDVILFTSSSTAENLALVKDERVVRALGEGIVACIGPVTADTARALGYEVGIVAPVHTTASLLDAVEEYFRGSTRSHEQS